MWWVGRAAPGRLGSCRRSWAPGVRHWGEGSSLINSKCGLRGQTTSSHFSPPQGFMSLSWSPCYQLFYWRGLGRTKICHMAMVLDTPR